VKKRKLAEEKRTGGATTRKEESNESAPQRLPEGRWKDQENTKKEGRKRENA